MLRIGGFRESIAGPYWARCISVHHSKFNLCLMPSPTSFNFDTLLRAYLRASSSHNPHKYFREQVKGRTALFGNAVNLNPSEPGLDTCADPHGPMITDLQRTLLIGLPASAVSLSETNTYGPNSAHS